MEKITAVVVTYNRLELLKRAVDNLRRQSRKLDCIIVVNNGSTDGTHEWLDEQTDLCVIHQDNVGGSGGFYRGIEFAYNQGFDWIWCMDDDVYPAEDCLEKLLTQTSTDVGILCPLRKQNGQIFVAEVKTFNLKNPFRSLHVNILKEEDVLNTDHVSIEGMSFEGPLIKRDVIQKIGLPNKDLFILYDDSDYSYRAILAGFMVYIVPDATLFKELFNQDESRETIIRKGKWKLYYNIRNSVYFNKVYGRNFMVKYIRTAAQFFRYCLVVIFNIFRNKKYEWRDFLLVSKAYFDGIQCKLGKSN